jgi:hypothetical protein
MVINNKKGYLRTLESIIAVVLLMVVVFSSISINEPSTKKFPTEIEIVMDRILNEVQTNQQLRDYLVQNENNLLLDYLFSNFYQHNINIDIDICQDSIGCEVRSNELTTNDVYTNSLIVYEQGSIMLFRLYLWYDDF